MEKRKITLDKKSFEQIAKTKEYQKMLKICKDVVDAKTKTNNK